jgi:hypothetical protein
MRHRVAFLLLLSAGCGGIASKAGPGAAPDVSVPAQPPPPNPPVAATAWNTLDAEGPVTALVATKDSVCWTSFTKGNPSSSLVACASKSDGHRVEFLRDTNLHPGLAASPSDLYWSTDIDATIDRAPLAGGAPSHVVTTKGPHDRFVLARGTLYWLVDGGFGSILFASGVGAEPSEIANFGPGYAQLLAVLDYTVYDFPVAYAYGAGPSFCFGVQQLRVGSGQAPQALSKGNCSYPTDLAADTAYVYWSSEDRSLHWVPRQGGDEHVEPNAGWGALATWQGLAYLADMPGGRVLRARPTEGALDVLQGGLAGVTRIAVDDSGIYVGVGTTIRRFLL